MKKLFVLFALSCYLISFGQVTLQGNRLVKDSTSYKLRQYKEVFTNRDAQQYFKKARTNKTVGSIFAYTGGFLMGFSAAKAIAEPKYKEWNTGFGIVKVEGNRKMWWTYAAAGAGLAAVSIPFALGAKKNADKALEIENGAASAFQPYFKFETAGSSVSLSYHF